MFGSHSLTRCQGLFVFALWVGSSGACTETAKPNELGFRVRFACPADSEQSDLLRLRIVTAGCDAQGEVVYEAKLAHGDQAPAASSIAPGMYGIEATALSGDAVVARSCNDVRLPSQEAVELVLRSDTCADEAPLDADVEMDAARDAGENEPDAAFDAAEPDAPPLACESDCVDSDPCTEDLCVDGRCSNPAFSGARECDGIACTEGDTCVEGECQAGSPNDAACADDGNPCSAERCVAGVGCNRSNAGADGLMCDDNIACTSGDSCKSGVCSGMDNCGSGEVCSAAVHMCLACTGAQDCNDSNPCTTDTCNTSTGKCAHANNSASCDDGKSCTNNDTCAGGACSGTSTCPSDATCGGTTCSCNDSGETLCGNRCSDLETSTTDCGLCGRACSGGSCQNGACKPSGATTCTAYRSGGHDYLVCTDALNWAAARDRCESYGLVLVAIESQGENAFLDARLGGAPRWIGANDRDANGADGNGNNCRLSQDEGSWYWVSTTSNKGTRFCTVAASGAVVCNPVSGAYVNWHSGEPNNGSCGCSFQGCTEGQDCATIDPGGLWDDDLCSATLGYICETP